MQTKKIAWLISAGILVSNTVLAMDPRAIVQQTYDRDDGKTQYSKQTVATCKYELKGNALNCVEKPRIKVIEAVRKDYGANGKDKKTVMIVLDPPAEAGIGFLQYDYNDKDKESDQWMYLSAMGKVKRIVSGDNDEPKTGSLFGSEFSYEDVEQPHIDNYVYNLLKEENFQGSDCWVIETTPTPEHARKSNYGKFVQWIDKAKYVQLKLVMYDRGGRISKQLVMSDYVKQDNVWIAKKLNIMNLVDSRISTMKLNDVVVNSNVDDQLLTQRTLTDGAFRESKLAELRNSLR